MFTGIVTAVGTVIAAEKRGDMRLRISAPLIPSHINIGASIACSGVCLTVVDRGGPNSEAWFDVDVSSETISRTAKAMWEKDAKLNIEPSLRMGDELGGHIVTGHVDGVGKVNLTEKRGDSWHVEVNAPHTLAAFIAPKGSITVQGDSLTVNDIRDEEDGSCTFMLNIIPHTGDVTTLGELKQGSEVNLEIDVLARYLRRMQDLSNT